MHAFRFDDLASTEPGSFFRLDSREEAHLFRILRARPGETAAVLDGHGTLGTAVVEADRQLRLESKRTVPPPARKQPSSACWIAVVASPAWEGTVKVAEGEGAESEGCMARPLSPRFWFPSIDAKYYFLRQG